MEEKTTQLLDYIDEELKTLSEQGCDTWDLERQAAMVRKDAPYEAARRAAALAESLEALSPAADFPFHEPSELEAIRAARPGGPRKIAVGLTPEVLENRTLGAWLGRVAGCMLGKPVEGWSRERIRDLLDACGLERLDDYVPAPPPGCGIAIGEGARGALRGQIEGALRDDDIDYTIAGLCIVERHGRTFTPDDVARFWLENLPYLCTYTAERVTYRNLVSGIRPPRSARYRNPYREWIGAQIRADAFGYVCPGRPEPAAELAFKDASISHTRNGIYGEMWVAAMLAAAFVANDVEKVIRVGLSEIPARCRLADALERVIEWHAEGIGADAATERLLEEFGRYHPVHTINNAAIVALALLWGDKDFTRTVGLAVEAGLDTDCNGATAGSVLGAMIGARALPPHWVEPLGDRVETIVAGQRRLTLTGLVARTRALQDQLLESAGP
jgi:ADP-ribosylglycohydrolase